MSVPIDVIVSKELICLTFAPGAIGDYCYEVNLRSVSQCYDRIISVSSDLLDDVF